MWFNQPTYNSYTPYNYGYSSFEDPYSRAVARERAAREREAAARHADFLRWQQMQDAARSPYNSYLSDDDDGSYIPYNPRGYGYTPHTHEDLKGRQDLERQPRPELARQAKLNRRREAPEEPASASTPHLSIPISSPGGPSSPTEPTRLPKRPSPPPSPKPATPEATPEQIRAARMIQEFYRNRMARRQALAPIAEISTQFEKLKSAFSPPRQLDYRGDTPEDTISIPVSSESFVHASSIPTPFADADYASETSKSNPPLAYTSNNKVLHEYVENLNRLVDTLDTVECGGHATVREQRKQLIRSVEAEAQRIDRWIAEVWNLAQAQPESQPSSQPPPQPTMVDAFYQDRRTRQQALASIAEISTKFEQFKSAFSPPPQLDYSGTTPISIPVSPESFVHASSIPPSFGDEDTETSKSNPPLAYTSNNRAVLGYVENLGRLLVELDRVECGGHAMVREQRKQLIRSVEAEAQRMDRWIAEVWNLAQPHAQVQPESQGSRQTRPRPTVEEVFEES